MIIHKLPQKLTNFSWSQLAGATIAGAKLLGILTHDDERNAISGFLSLSHSTKPQLPHVWHNYWRMSPVSENCKYEPKIRNQSTFTENLVSNHETRSPFAKFDRPNAEGGWVAWSLMNFPPIQPPQIFHTARRAVTAVTFNNFSKI